MTYKKGIGIILLISFLSLANLSFALPSFAQLPELPDVQPKTMEEAKKLGGKVLEVGKKELPGIIERIWKQEVLPIWQKMYNWFLENIWVEVWPYAQKEIEKRKPLIEEEFEKEKQELKEEAPELGKSLWQRFKELISKKN